MALQSWAGACSLITVLSACGAAGTTPTTASPATAESAGTTADTAAAGSGAESASAGGPNAASTEHAASPSIAGATPQSTPPSSTGGAGSGSTPSAGSADKQGESEGADANAPRNVKYFASPDSLRVEVEGVSFIPKAELVKKGKTWTVRVRVEARAKPGVSRTLLTPQSEPIAIAGSVKREAQGTMEKFVDHRNGDRETVVKGEKPTTLTRVWPAANGPKPLNEGDEVDLMVGLWGFGPDSGSMRPLTKLCRFHGKIERSKDRLIPEPPPGIGQ